MASPTLNAAPIGRSWRAQLRVVFVFIALLALFNGLYQVERRFAGEYFDIPYSAFVTRSVAHLSTWLLPFAVELKGDAALGTPHGSVIVRGGCNGIEAIFLMVAGILAVPASWRRRLLAAAIYLPTLYVLNLFRVLMLVYVVVAYPDSFDTFHFQVGQGVMVIAVMALWMRFVGRLEVT